MSRVDELKQRIAGIVDKIKKDTNKELEHSKRLDNLLKYTPKQPMSTKEIMSEHGYVEHGEKIRPDKKTMELEKRFDVDDIDAERTRRIDQLSDYMNTLTDEEMSAPLSHKDMQSIKDFKLDGKPLPPDFMKKKKTNTKYSKLKQRLADVAPERVLSSEAESNIAGVEIQDLSGEKTELQRRTFNRGVRLKKQQSDDAFERMRSQYISEDNIKKNKWAKLKQRLSRLQQ